MYKSLNNFDASDSNLYAKQNSLMGSLQTHQKQCNNYVAGAITILIKTGYFNRSNIRFIHLLNHVTCEFLYHGKWVFVDFDPGEPFFMIVDATGKYVSSQQIQQNRNLITGDQVYYYRTDAGNRVKLCGPESIETYQSRFDQLEINPVPYGNDPQKISGVVILPAHSQLVSEYKGVRYVFDSTRLVQLYRIYHKQDMDSAAILISGWTGISKDSAMIIVDEGKVEARTTTNNWSPNYKRSTPVIKIILPPSKDTLKLGTDVNFPGYVISSTIAVHLTDTVINAGKTAGLWTPNSNARMPVVSDAEVQYLAGMGYIPPHSGTDTISVSFNPMILNFGAGFRLGYMTGDSISVKAFLNDSLISTDSSYPKVTVSLKTH